MPKKQPAVLPKSKFGFIGRMPFVRKMKEATEEGKKSDSTEPTPPPPPVISSPTKPDASNLTNMAKVAKERVFRLQKALSLQPPPSVAMVMDMDIDMDTPDFTEEIPILPPPPVIRPQFPPEVTTACLGKSGLPLPQDFEEALSIIFPKNQRRANRIQPEPEPEPEPVTPPPPVMFDPTEMALLGIDSEDMAVKRFL